MYASRGLRVVPRPDPTGDREVRRFLVFRGESYYPDGGWLDFIGEFSSYGEAAREARKIECYGDGHSDNWSQIFDSRTRELREFPTEAEYDAWITKTREGRSCLLGIATTAVMTATALVPRGSADGEETTFELGDP